MNDTVNRYQAILCYPFASLDFFSRITIEEIVIKKKEREFMAEVG